MTVELDVFSGRPNPQWTLTQTEAARVEELLQDLPPAEKAVEPALGYRGFVMTAGKRRITVGKGVVHLEGEQTRTQQDAKGLEAYLQQLAREHGYEKWIESQHP